MKLSIINGPNLNLLGKREKDLYGNSSFEAYFQKLVAYYSEFEFDYFQSNSEGKLVSRIQEVGFSTDGIILNAAAYTHHSIALADAVRAVSATVVEVHISNVYQREAFRHRSTIAGVAQGVVVGFGLESYRLAIESFRNPV